MSACLPYLVHESLLCLVLADPGLQEALIGLLLRDVIAGLFTKPKTWEFLFWTGCACTLLPIHPQRSESSTSHWYAEAWDLGDEAAVRRRLRLELDDVARKRALQGYEIPRDFLLERDAFSKANYLLTDSGKPAVGRLREKCAPAPCT